MFHLKNGMSFFPLIFILFKMAKTTDQKYDA
jgi:hypothetical protein